MNRRPRTGGAQRWKALAGIALSAALLAFALRGVDAAEVLREVRQARPLPFLASIAGATAVFLVRAWRWRSLLQPVRPGTRLHSRFAATTIGFMVNNLLPVRVGEFARAFALSRLEPVPVVASFGSVVVERLLDAATIVAFLALSMALPGFPELRTLGGRNPDALVAAAATLCAAATLALAALVVWPRAFLRAAERAAERVLPRALRRPVAEALEAFVAGLGVLRHPALLARAALWSLALWLLGALSFLLGFRAFDIPVGFGGALFLQSLIALAVALPSAPGFFGLYEAGVRVGLVDVWGVELNKALAFAIGFHLGGFIPVTLIGLYYVWRLGLSWREVERSEELVEAAVERAGPDPDPRTPDR